jgi:hypothetical protein
MRDVIETHLDECTAAMDAQNKALEAAQFTFADATEAARKAYDDAIEVAQRAYGETLQTSRERAAKAMQDRMSVWNGEEPVRLPPVAKMEVSSVSSFESDPTGGSA